MNDYLIIKDVFQLIAVLERRQREVNTELDATTDPEAMLSLYSYEDGLKFALEAARKLATYDAKGLQTGFDFLSSTDTPIFSAK